MLPDNWRDYRDLALFYAFDFVMSPVGGAVIAFLTAFAAVMLAYFALSALV